MEVIKVPIENLKLHPKNPRVHPDSAINKLAKSMREFGWTNPILASEEGFVLAGHARLKAAKKAGIKEVPVIFLPLRGVKAEAYMIADNKLQDETDWDLPKLKDLLQELDIGDINIDITGFEHSDIEELMAQFYEPDEKDDEAPETPEEPITKLGDLYKLGEHRLLCGDATKIEDVEKLMNGQKADMVFTDPPYGINLDTDYSPISKNWKGRVSYCDSKTYKKIIGDNKIFNFKDFDWLDCREQFWWGANYYLKELPVGGSWFIWDKTAGHTQQVVGSEFEMLWSKQKHRQEILMVKWAGVMGLQTQDIKKRIHPTQKPIQLCEWFIHKFSNKDNIIIDLFGGSGSTLIACEKLKRRCYMMEIDPYYCDVIVKRWEKYIGKNAEREKGI